MASPTLPANDEPVNIGGRRARCPTCLHRFLWPASEPWTAIEPLVRPEVACPACRLVVRLVEEPLDERWHKWSQTVEPKVTVHVPPQRSHPRGVSRRVHRPNVQRGSGGVQV